jgi:hypothetical protein
MYTGMLIPTYHPRPARETYSRYCLDTIFIRVGDQKTVDKGKTRERNRVAVSLQMCEPRMPCLLLPRLQQGG